MKKIYCFFVASVAALMVGCSHLMPERVDVREVPVGVVTVAGGSYECYREYAGTLEEKSSTSISFEVGGRVTSVKVRDGQHVRAGQLLATIDNTTARNAYNAAKAALDRAQDGYNRAKQVYDKGSLPEVKWVEVQTQLDQARSMEEISRKNLEDCNLYAPVDGTVCDKDLEVGMSVNPLRPVMRLVNMQGIFVKASIPEIDINKVHVGDVAQTMISAMADTMYSCVVEERNVDADPLSHCYMVRLRIKGGARGLLPGMVCRVRFASDESHGGFEVPNRAVQLDNDGRRFVWVVKDSLAERRFVKIGNLTTTGVLVSEGLEPGDAVIVDGGSKVGTGMKVAPREI